MYNIQAYKPKQCTIIQIKFLALKTSLLICNIKLSAYLTINKSCPPYSYIHT